MKSTFKILSLFFILSFLTARFGFVFDNPEHFLHPDPDCQLCQQKDVQFLIDSYKVILNDLCIIDIIEILPPQEYSLGSIVQIDLIRAPPAFFI